MIVPGTILIVQIGKIGDMILTTPLFREIKKKYPDAIISVLASDINKTIAQNNEHVDKVYVYKKNILSNLPLYFSSLKNPDLWIDTKNNFSRTSAFLLKLFKPKLSMGYNFSDPVFDIDLTEYQSGNHATEINLTPVYYLTGKNVSRDITPEIEIPDYIKAKTFSLLNRDTDFRNIVINLSAGDESRYLESENWVSTIRGIGDKSRYFIYLIGMEKDKKRIDSIMNKTEDLNVNYIKTKSILDTSEVIRKSNITISPDTSIIHICSAFNIPVIGIYPDVKWNLEKFYPLSEKKEIIISKSSDNIKDVTSEQIINSFNLLIKKI